MRKLILLIVLLAVGFYVGWPAWNGYAIKTALEREDSTTLAQKIDFPQVRASIREPVMVRLDDRIDQMVRDFGPAFGITKDQVKLDRITEIVNGALDDVVSPDRVGAIYKQGGDFVGAVQQAVLQRVDRMGGIMELFDVPPQDEGTGGSANDGNLDLSNGIGGLLRNKQARSILNQVTKQLGQSGGLSARDLFAPKRETGASPAGDQDAGFGFSNIKHFWFRGPLAMEAGIARDASAEVPDVTARITFQDFDWKVTHLVPRIP
ncbi:MAG: DUF2939 domain-containing protein [Pseudomonadota bacterium]